MDERAHGAIGLPRTSGADPREGAPQEQRITVLATEHSAEGARDEPHEEAGVEEAREEEERFWPALRARMLSWRTMTPSLRLITGVAIAQLIAAAAIIALHGLRLPQVGLGLQNGHAIQMAAPFFWASIAFTIISMAFLMTAALMMRWPIRLIALALFSALMLSTPAPLAFSVFRWVSIAILWLWAGVVALALSDIDTEGQNDGGPLRRLRGNAQRWVRAARARFPGAAGAPLPVATLSFMLLWQLAYYAALLATAGWMTSATNDFFQLTISVQLASLSGALIPFLFLAGSDFVELGELIGAGAASGIASLGSGDRTGARGARMALARWLTVGAAVILSLYIVITYAPSTRTGLGRVALTYLGELALVAALALALYALLRWGSAASWPTARLSSLTLLLVSLGYFGLLAIPSAMLVASSNAGKTVVISDYSVYRAPVELPAFSMPYPSGWTSQALHQPGGAISVVFDGFSQTFTGRYFVEIQPDPGADANTATAALNAYLTSAESSGQVTNASALSTDGEWQTAQFTARLSSGATLRSKAWARATNGYIWIAIGSTFPAYQDALFPVFETMTQGWRPDYSAVAPVSAESSDTAAAKRAAALYLGLIPLVLSLIAGLWLVRRRGARSPMWNVAGVFVATFGLLTGAQMTPLMLQVAGAPKAATWFLGLPVENLLQGVALATLGLCAYALIWRRMDTRWLEAIRLALALNVGLLFISLMSNLYDKAIAASQSSAHHSISWAEALIVLIALGWDLLMSGETFTNRDDKWLPRHNRLLLYLGYILLTATLVVFFSAQSYTYATSAHESFFESEPWPQMGLQTLGPAMVVTAFALGLATLLGRARTSGRPSTLRTLAPTGAALAGAVDSEGAR